MNNNDQKMLSEEEARRILDLPALVLPYVFKNGSFMEGFSIGCCGCNQTLKGDAIKGEFSAHNEMSASLDGYGVCVDCNLFSPFNVKIRNDGTLLVKTAQGWKESRYTRQSKLSVVGRIRQLIFGA